MRCWAPMALLAWPEATQGTAAPPLVTLASLRRPSESTPGPAGGDAFVEAVAQGYEAGLAIDFQGLFAGEVRRRISLPGYPFQRHRHWVELAKRRRTSIGHPLLGVRHETPRGEITFETEIFASDPVWVKDHLVFGQGRCSGRDVRDHGGHGSVGRACPLGGPGECQLHSPMILPLEESEDEEDAGGRKLQIVFDGADRTAPRRFEVFSRGSEDGWTLHLEGRMSSGESPREDAGPADLEALRMNLAPGRHRIALPQQGEHQGGARTRVSPTPRRLVRRWRSRRRSGAPGLSGRRRARPTSDPAGRLFSDRPCGTRPGSCGREVDIYAFGWDRLWLSEPPPERIFCHVRMREAAGKTDPKRPQTTPRRSSRPISSSIPRPESRSAVWTGSR